MKTNILLSHPFGNANVRQSVLALAEANMLGGFRTCINWQPGVFSSMLPRKMRRLFARRSFPQEITEKTTIRPFYESGRLLASRLKWNFFTSHETGVFSVDAVLRDLDRAVANELRENSTDFSAVYAYEDGAEHTFVAARERGLDCYYDLPIGYWRTAQAILSEEAELRPEWAGTLTTMLDSPQKTARKDHEIELADKIVVASRYTASTLADSPLVGKPVHVVPYGCPEAQAKIAPPHSGPLRVLFVGSLGQRKGTSYLLEATAMFPDATLTLLGAKPDQACAPLQAALRSHKWIPSLSHSAVLEQMRQHDLLVFPSLFEGFGLVILEALSQGIPVITTPHTGGPDVLTDGSDGFIVPIRDAVAIAEKLELLHRDRSRLAEMKSAALRKAQQLRWETYRRELVRVINLIEND